VDLPIRSTANQPTDYPLLNTDEQAATHIRSKVNQRSFKNAFVLWPFCAKIGAMIKYTYRALLLLSSFILCSVRLWAGGGGLNVVVVVNQNSTNSVQLGNYYCERRQIPPQNVLRVNWTGSNIQWTKSEFETVLLNPLLAMLSARQLTNQIDYVLLSMDLPYRVVHTGSVTESGNNSTTSALFYGFKPDFSVPSFGLPSCNLPAASSNSYAGSEAVFRATPLGAINSNSFLVSMLTSSNLAAAKLVIDRAVTSDSSMPTQPVFLGHSDDRLRNIRYWLFDDAIFNARLRGNYAIQATNVNHPNSLGSIAGYESGIQWGTVGSGIFLPGAMADNITSFSGQIFEQPNNPEGHLTALAFLNAGAAGSYGTIVEPCAWLQKFPSPQNYFYQARGFTLAECYYQSVTNPYQGLLLGEPLAAPYALRPSAAWNNLPLNAVLSGTTNLSLNLAAADPRLPVQQVDLFVDGTLSATLTNIPPRANNVLSVTINGHTMTYIVLANDSINSIATGLVAMLNLAANINVTKVRAFARGDRIELRSLDSTKGGSQVAMQVNSATGAASALTTFISASSPNFLDTAAHGIRSYVITNIPSLGEYLQLIATKTNGQTVSVSVTNTSNGATLADFARSLFSAVNSTPALQGPDGLVIEDVNMHEDPPYAQFIYGLDDHSGEFNVRARAAGWAEAQIAVRITGSAAFGIQPSGTNRLDESVGDLQPRNHLYITAGVTNMPLSFAWNTTAHSDGFHELSAVVYEGSHVRTQRKVSQSVKIQNHGLSANFTTLVGNTNSALEGTLQFSVVANNNISKIELFSTGGALSNVTGLSSATFSVAGTNLGLGLHPFYAIVTAPGGAQYRTETKWVRLVGADTPFALSITAPPATLSWPAVPGRQYEILSATNPADAFQLRDSITASNGSGFWIEPQVAAPQRFYRIRTSD
jgi:uncharacterized protein (TIGR03790 family)